MKKKILVCALIVICLSIAAYGTTAFFTYRDRSENVITMGNIKVELQELTLSEGAEDPLPFNGAVNILPGTEVSKIVQVKNVGTSPAWVRISVEKNILLADGADGASDTSLITYNINMEKWVEKDGYYYYKDILKTGETTVPLFTEVSFDPSMGNMYSNSKAVIVITVHATQTAHNGSEVLEAAGWPEKD